MPNIGNRTGRVPRYVRTMNMLNRSVAAALVSGTVDLAFAFAYYGWQFGVGPQRILQSIASGWQGAAARDGGWASAALGAVSHYAILVVAAWWYLIALNRSGWMRAHPWLGGFAYGACIFFVMNLVVVPLSAAPPRNFVLLDELVPLAAHVLLIGPAISWTLRRTA
jgi:hypothetical protein